MSAWVYILANRYRGTTYIGVTRDIARRTWQHKTGTGSKFARRYDAYRLVYVEQTELVVDAIAREKALKKWNRDWKIELIEQANPNWEDLFDRLNG
ncbi:GIY-YIG nuclease family protein [Sphingomonas sp. SUN039]|uniref:GIY-YIG nuclease family protein n=1 Tax=Sphingomonas sp. SUN039 TaxID=2937787 RepID=UPI002164C3DF|nr:GIY-YIG nuclease family protein [Sphingomonas sp. SUN039]UVO53154.1 GIY-YIG nuclease family protein [Sphingomonas sp. SUN039]